MYTSVGVAVGLFIVKLTGVNWIDPVAAIAVAVLILYTAYRLIVTSGRVLLDETLPESELEIIRGCVKEHRGDLIVVKSDVITGDGPTRETGEEDG